MKVGLFADAHYCDQNKKVYGKVKKVLKKMKEVDLIVCLGDLIDRSGSRIKEKKCIEKMVNLLNKMGKEYYVLAGNHDCMVFPKEHFSRLTHSPKPPYAIQKEDCLLLFLDGNYNKEDKPQGANTNEWTDVKLPKTEVNWLKETLLKATEKKIYVFMHQNIVNSSDSDYVIANAEEVKEILAKDGRVLAVYQGHFHKGGFETEKGIQYITLPSVKNKCELPYSIEIL